MGLISEIGFHKKSSSITIKSQVGKIINISITENSSIGIVYSFLETNYKEYLKQVEDVTKGKDMCGCDTYRRISYECIKPGTAIIKLQWKYRGSNEGITTYKIKISK